VTDSCSATCSLVRRALRGDGRVLPAENRAIGARLDYR
jgi:hypothetical protein